jgi:hypothetical protein
MSTILYSIEVNYKSESTGKWEVSQFRLRNFTGQKVMEFRNNVFVGGVYRKITEDMGEVISPWNIMSIFIYRQEKFFEGE